MFSGCTLTMTVTSRSSSLPPVATQLLALDEAIGRLEQLDARQARVIELRFFVGLNVEETAAALDISAATVKREWVTGRAWLLRQLRTG
jgi:DNA-directed RNA polymerase specialized sigma24 family protein